MKSDVIHVTSEGTGYEQALLQADAVARFKELPKKTALHLRLLTEEMMGMLRGLTGELEADFWIEDKDNEINLHLLAATDMNYKKRRKLLEASTSGKNKAAAGVTGKIRELLERAFEPYDENLPECYASGWMASDSSYSAAVAQTAAWMWSFNKYRDTVSEENKPEEWDELEKSIVARLADEIQIGIMSDRVEMIITKKY